jgi:hypothetical protein
MSVPSFFKNNRVAVLVVLLLIAAVPFAAADSFSITSNNIGLSGVLGTVTTTQSGSNVNVSIQMNSGYAFLVNGGDLGFTTTGGLVLADGSLTNFSLAGMSSSLKNNTTVGGFTFDYLFKTSVSGGQQTPTTLTFTILNANVSQISGLGIHLCVLGGEGCATTGFATTGPTPVPEPGTLSLLGTGLISLGGLARRRFKK